MKKDPDKYSSLIYNDIYSLASSAAIYATLYHSPFDSFGNDLQYPSPDNHSDECIRMLVNEAETVYNNLTKQMTDESIVDYADSTTSHLPSLPPLLIKNKNKRNLKSKETKWFHPKCRLIVKPVK